MQKVTNEDLAKFAAVVAATVYAASETDLSDVEIMRIKKQFLSDINKNDAFNKSIEMYNELSKQIN